MAANALDEGEISFQTEGRLLQELGLRLVAKPDVALVELIKNAYDADSTRCVVSLNENQTTLIVLDDGSGMTIDDFKTKWMRIATSSKVASQISPKFRRPLTGAKGIGRFAVRYLGDHLILESVAFDKKYEGKTRLRAVFDWPSLDNTANISDSKVHYSLVKVSDDTQTGTTLTISKLRTASDFVRDTKLRDEVLRIVTPLQGLDHGHHAIAGKDNEVDIGFRVILPGDSNKTDIDLAKLVLDNFWGRLTVSLIGQQLKFRVWLPRLKKPRELDIKVSTCISNGFFADIRYFPRRKGTFQAKGINGKEAWKWVRENSGIKVVDHGFHIRPYGFPNNDWVLLDLDKAHSARDWRTKIADTYFAVAPIIRNDPSLNPVLNLAYTYQLVGAVFIASRRDLKGDEIDLIPAMDREGLLENLAFDQLYEYVRAGLEFLAHEDKAELDRYAREEAAKAARTAREDIQKAIRFIEQSPTLTNNDKSRIVTQYRQLAERVDETEELSAAARRNLLTMNLLGVVAGFMTHESKAIVHELSGAVGQVSAIAEKHPELFDASENLKKRLSTFQGYLDYTKIFVDNVRSGIGMPLKAAAQVERVIEQYGNFALERDITVTSDIASDVITPPLPVAVYGGVLLNLYTNALKAVLAVQDSRLDRAISFKAWNEKDRHIIEIADNGIGIPPELHKRIWEPLYTTTSDTGNPLGSGMGLGLTLIKQVVNEFGGTISLLPVPPPGFTTCFRVTFVPQKIKHENRPI